jgi:phosphohistidine phosphatase SixA
MVEAMLRDTGDPVRPVLVGHDPDFTDLVEILTGSAALTMKKGAIVRIDIERPLAAGAGNLAWLVTPELLKPAR